MDEIDPITAVVIALILWGLFAYTQRAKLKSFWEKYLGFHKCEMIPEKEQHNVVLIDTPVLGGSHFFEVHRVEVCVKCKSRKEEAFVKADSAKVVGHTTQGEPIYEDSLGPYTKWFFQTLNTDQDWTQKAGI